MVFSSTVFLFLFLPLVLALYFLFPRVARNGVLLVASLVYYAWGESTFLPLVFVSIVGNYVFGLAMQRLVEGRARKLLLGVAVVMNIGLLVWFKYANFFVHAFNVAAHQFPSVHHSVRLHPIALPLGISFFTFHALSYVIDIYRRQAVAQRSLPRLGLYILFFPQLVAGPIVRYHEISDQLGARQVRMSDLAAGIERFVIGLAKKMLIANVTAEIADGIFAVPLSALTTGLAWLGACAYAIQIYFDFSGYSDMAIGLARLFGFRFPENFDYPYISRSVTEFWRRWHLSLSRWFRDYLYIPLGGNRRGGARTYLNLVTVFFLCGLWHGASWTFVIWGLIHGAFLVIERRGLLRVLDATWSPLRHVYCLLVVLVTWVFFRAPSLTFAHSFLRAMAGLGEGDGVTYRAVGFLDDERIFALVVGAVGATPVAVWLRQRLRPENFAALAVFDLGKLAALATLATASAMRLSSGTYNPFIYFRF
jgi:alginate O-acetyltransferase complex protein AlgI